MTMSYIDGFIIPVPTGDDLPDGEVTERAVQVRDDETVVFGWVLARQGDTKRRSRRWKPTRR